MIKGIQGVWVRTLAIALLLPGAAWAQSATVGTSSPQQAPPVDRYVVGTAKPPQVPGTTQLDLTLEQAIQFAPFFLSWT